MKLETHILCSIGFFFNFYDTIWKNIVETRMSQVMIWGVRIACWVPRATNTYIGCVILIAFALQHERISVLRYTCIACLVHP